MDGRLVFVMERLANYPAERPRLPELAKAAGISVRMLELLFIRYTGKPFSACYRELRVTLAKELLARTGKPVKVISSRLGYRAVEVFCRDFRRECGCTAMEYRSRSRELLRNRSIVCGKGQLNEVDGDDAAQLSWRLSRVLDQRS